MSSFVSLRAANLICVYQVIISKNAVQSELINQDIKRYVFEVILSNKYPFRDPAVFCHTKFSHKMLTMTDKRDFFTDIIGNGEWKIGHKIYTLIQMIPEFIQEVYLMEDDELKNLGTFHLGQIYDLTFYVGTDPSMAVFPCQE